MTRADYDSEFCGNLPIHLINHIQAYGALIILDRSSLRILQVSENINVLFGVPAENVIMRTIDEFIDADSVARLAEHTSLFENNKVPATWRVQDKSFVAIIHATADMLLAELDLQVYDNEQQRSFVEVYGEIKVAVARIQNVSSIQQLADISAKELKRISGIDKVMIYQFDEQWNGTVLSEAAEDDMEEYLGITFPASDIPRQARELYHRNPFRWIPTREYTPVRLYPVINPLTNSFVDLSACNVRSVPAVHIEYLANMNVMASMSVRILSGERLWGLIACHHKTQMMLSYELRSVFELLSNIISAKVLGLQNMEHHAFERRTREQYNTMIEDASRHRRVPENLLEGAPDILALFRASGAVISSAGKLFMKGTVPGDEYLRELILWLHAKELRTVYSSDALSAEFDHAESFREAGSGLLVIPINFAYDEYLILFRPEKIRVINWGGDPSQRITFEKEDRKYHPRKSFEKWQQKVQGTSVPWRPEEIAAAEDLRVFIHEFST